MKRTLIVLAAVAPMLPPAPPPRARSVAPIKLTVDATEAPRKLLRAREVIPVRPGPLTLHYPKWIPGEHGPTGPIVNLAGLHFTAAGRTVPWRRDPSDMYAFHLDVPDDAHRVEAAFEYLAPDEGRFGAGP